MQNHRNKKTLNVLISEYEAMSQRGTVVFLEEAVFERVVSYYLSNHQSHHALEVLEHAIVQYPYSAKFYAQQGEILIYDGQYEEAMLSLNKASLYNPSSVEIAILKVKALMELGVADEAFEIIDTTKPIAFGKALSQIYYFEAELYQHKGKYHRMYDSLRYALTINPQNEDALDAMMWAIEVNGKYDEGIEIYEKIIDDNPYCDRAWFNLGHAYAGLDNLPMAMEAFEYAFITNPDNEYAYREYGQTCIKAQKYERALDCYDEAREKFHPDGDMWLSIGQCYEAMGDIVNARVHYKRAVKQSPQNALAHYRMGNCFAYNLKWEKAVKAYKKAMRLNRRKEEYVAGLANAFFHTGQIKKARSLYQKAADMAPETSEYWLKHASFLLNIGEAANAISVLDEAELYTSGEDLLYCRIAALFQIGRRQEALYLLGEALIYRYDMHAYLMELMPSLEHDLEVIMLIKKYQPV